MNFNVGCNTSQDSIMQMKPIKHTYAFCNSGQQGSQADLMTHSLYMNSIMPAVNEHTLMSTRASVTSSPSHALNGSSTCNLLLSGSTVTVTWLPSAGGAWKVSTPGVNKPEHQQNVQLLK